MKTIYCHSFETPFGIFRLSATEKGLYAIESARRRVVIASEAKQSRRSLRRFVPRDDIRITALLRKSARLLCSYFEGKKVSFRRLPVDWRGYTPFEKKVLQSLRKIPRGKLASYQSLARRAGRPRAPRGVGQVLHQNRLPFFIPCHRIVLKNGGLGGFSRGLAWKKRLLKIEGASVDKLDG